MRSLDGALPGRAAAPGAIGGASGVPGPTDTRARSHHGEADLSADGPRQPATGFIPGRSGKSGSKLIPTRSKIDLFQIGVAGGATDAFGGERIPGLAERIGDGIVGVEQAMAQMPLA